MNFAVALSVEYSAFSHATEDQDKVLKAVENLVPPRLRGRGELAVEDTLGHHQNPIRIFKVSFRNPEQAMQALSWLLGGLPGTDRERLIESVDLHLDEKLKLYMRLDKQEAYLGRFKLASGDDVVKVKFSFKGSREAVRQLLERLSGEALG
ncbi:MAG: RNA-binding domain-containing protein [Candidatus Nezhaarchaeota archaeon]|nr:RNA-binding domain-containing protein [Candidatus Nezhaarchaeota archaeon]